MKESNQVIRMPIKNLTETEKEVIAVIKSRWKKGRETYGEGISYKQRSTNLQWVENAIEEAADMLQYLVALKIKLQKESKKND